MNRITAILLAMAALLVHIVVVHRNALGVFATPYDSAHAAFHLGRNLAHYGSVFWNIDPETGVAAGGLGSYPSPLLIWLSAGVEVMAAWIRSSWFTVTRIVQFIGVGCALGTVFLSTRFDTDRNAGVIPALLLVFSGAVAAAGASGTEWPIVMFLMAMAFVTLEHGRRRFASVSLMLLAIASPVGVVGVLTLALQTLIRALRARRRSATDRGTASPKSPTLLVFLPAVVALTLVHRAGASLLPDLAAALQFEPYPVQHGIARLRDFIVITAAPVLLVFPLIALAMGELSSVGLRALTLGLILAATTALMGGGDPDSFGIAFTPALAMLFIAIQQGMARALDTYRRSMERLVWVSIGSVLFVALFASRFPGDLGQIKVQRVQERVYDAHARRSPGGSLLLGRSALHSQIRLTEQLREVGSFLRTRLPEGSTIMTPWPGAIAYLSRHQVLDFFGRTTPLNGRRRTGWSPSPPIIDIEAALELKPDYILPSSKSINGIPKGELVDMIGSELLNGEDQLGEALHSAVQARLARYEMVVTPGSFHRRQLDPNQIGRRELVGPFVLFRKRGIQNPPQLRLHEAGEFLEVRLGFDQPVADPSGAQRRALIQVFDADISLRMQDGSTLLLSPTGERMVASVGSIRSVTGMLVDPLWTEAVTIARVPKSALAEGARSLEARVYHHMMGLAEPGMNREPNSGEDAVAGSSPSAVATAPLIYALR
ncbi:MAG: hypothetical protein ACJA2W_000253 [Planctomycetota bacterium]|jgi:hypothetical protein